MKKIDLHTHSNFSDGTYTPTELVEYAIKKNLSAIALTDHDTIVGIKEAKQASELFDIELIPGTELTADFKGIEIHILGYFIDIHNKNLNTNLTEFKRNRKERNLKMIKKLNNDGLEINYKDLQMGIQDAVITRAHFAKVIFEKGYVNSTKIAYEKYLSSHSKTYVAKEKFSAKKQIDLINSSGGISALAHPLLYKLNKENLESMIKSLEELGLDAIETIYSTNSIKDELFIRNLAKKYHLKITGGSDFHGNNKKDIDLGVGKGNLFIPYEILSKLKDS